MTRIRPTHLASVRTGRRRKREEEEDGGAYSGDQCPPGRLLLAQWRRTHPARPRRREVKVIWLSHGEADESGLLYEQQPDILLTHWKDELTYPTHLMTATPPCGRR